MPTHTASQSPDACQRTRACVCEAMRFSLCHFLLPPPLFLSPLLLPLLPSPLFLSLDHQPSLLPSTLGLPLWMMLWPSSKTQLPTSTQTSPSPTRTAQTSRQVCMHMHVLFIRCVHDMCMFACVHACRCVLVNGSPLHCCAASPHTSSFPPPLHDHHGRQHPCA